MDKPDSPGWWAFEGSKIIKKQVVCEEDDPDCVGHDWFEDENYEEDYLPYKYVNEKSGNYRWVVEIVTVYPNVTIKKMDSYGPHRGDPVLGFKEPDSWIVGYASPEKFSGTWTRVTGLPWENENDN